MDNEQSTMDNGQLAIRARPELPALKMDKEAFLLEYAPVKIVEKYSKVSTALQATAAEIPTLLDLEKAYGREYSVGYIQLWLVALADFLDIKQPTPLQLQLSASTIYDKNKTLNLADLKVVTEQILSGDVPLTAVRSDKVCPLLTKYWQRRCTENQEHNDAQQKIVVKATLDVNVVLDGYAKDLAERTAAQEGQAEEAKRKAEAMSAKCRMAEAIIKRNKEQTKATE